MSPAIFFVAGAGVVALFQGRHWLLGKLDFWLFGPSEQYYDTVGPRAGSVPLELRRALGGGQVVAVCRCGSFSVLCGCPGDEAAHAHAPHLLTGKGGARVARRLLRAKTVAPLKPVADLAARRGGKR